MPDKEIDKRFPLADMMLQMWKYDYFTKWARYVYHECRYRNRVKAIPTPFE